MNIRQNLRALIAEGLHLTLGHMLALFLTGLLGAAYLWLRSLEEHLLAVGALVSAAAVLLAFVTLIGRRIWRQGPITPRLGGGEERGHAMQRDDRDMRKLGLVHLHVDGDVNDVLQLIEEFNSESNRPHGQPKFKYNGIRDWIGGPQRADLPKVYQAHTPGVGAREQFSSFSASESVPLEAAVATLKRIVPIALKRPGVVIEAEYVEAIIGGGENVPSLEAGE